MDTLFPFLPPGWSVAVQDGQYRAVWPDGSMARFQLGNEGWSGREGQPPGPSVTVELLTPAGERAAPATRNRLVWVSPVGHAHGSGWSPSVQAFPPLGSHPPVFSPGEHKRDYRRMHVLAQPVPGQMDRAVQDSPIGMGGSLPSLFTPVSGARRSGRGMRPAGWNSRFPKKLSCDYVVTENSMVSEGKTSEVGKLDSFSDELVVKRNVGDAPLPGDDVNSHPQYVPSLGAAEKNRQEGYKNSVPPREVTGEASGLNDAAVLTPAIAGAASSAVFAGAVFPAVAGMEFPAVAKDLSLADDAGGCPHLPVLVNRFGLLLRRLLWICGALRF